MYPKEIDRFTEKLNKLDNNAYVIEEEITINNGVYEGELKHDNVSSINVRVYTGSKLTGDKIDNFILSTPSQTPWKTIIKIFSSTSPVYITYETPGDTVEAEDINEVQESIVNTQKEVDKYKSSNVLEVGNLKVRASNLENNKSEKTYVDTELNKRYLKEQVFTKEEVLQKIQDLIGTAPQTLDTFKELADALGNDPSFATTIMNLLGGKVDKVQGKQLSTEDYTTIEKQKLAGVEANANKYTHPSSHSADMVVENINRRFVSDIERSNWDDAHNKTHQHENKSILDKITQTLIDSWNSAVEHIKDTVKHITQVERDKWNCKADVSSIPTKVGQLENDKKYITQSELGNAGYGDMNKVTYDKNNNGTIDLAEAADSINFIDNRSTDDKPKDLQNRKLTGSFKYITNVGNPPVKASGDYVFILNIVGWNGMEGSGGWPIQLAVGGEGLAYRQAISEDTWGKWIKLTNINDKKVFTWNDLKGV